MITIMTSCKAFKGATGELQIRSIRNWKALHPDVEVFVFGQAEMADTIAVQEGFSYIPGISSTAQGIPFFNAIVEYANRHAKHDMLLYLNADILLPAKLLDVLPLLEGFDRFLVCGQRIDLQEPLDKDFPDAGWEGRLPRLVAHRQAILHAVTGIDYFLFKRGMWHGLPPLIIGRGGYDGALLAYCLRQSIPVIDASWAIPVLHQFHDYGHVAGGVGEAHRGEDARQNRLRHDIAHSVPVLTDADWIIVNGRLENGNARGDSLRKFEVFLRYKHHCKALGYLVRVVWRLLGMGKRRVPQPDWSCCCPEATSPCM